MHTTVDRPCIPGQVKHFSVSPTDHIKLGDKTGHMTAGPASLARLSYLSHNIDFNRRAIRPQSQLIYMINCFPLNTRW